MKKIYKRITVLFTLLFLFSFTVHAQENHTQLDLQQQEIKTLEKQIQLTQRKRELLQKELAGIAEIPPQLNDEQIALWGTQRRLSRSNINLALARANLVSMTQMLDELRTTIKQTRDTIKKVTNKLQNAKVKTSDQIEQAIKLRSLNAQLEYLNSVSTLQQSRLSELEKTRVLLSHIVERLTLLQQGIARAYQINQNRQREAALQKLIEKNQGKRKQWLDKLALYTGQFQTLQESDATTETQLLTVQLKIFQAQEMLALLELDVRLAKFNDKAFDLERDLLSEQELHLGAANKVAKYLEGNILEIKNKINVKQHLIAQQSSLLSRTYHDLNIDKKFYYNENLLLQQLHQAYLVRQNELDKIAVEIKNLQVNIQQHLTQVIARRHGLPGFEWQAWLGLMQQMSYMPRALMTSIKALYAQLKLGVKDITYWEYFLLTGMLLFWFVGGWWLKNRLTVVLNQLQERRQSTSANIIYITLELLRRNFTPLTVLAAIMVFFHYVGIPAINYRLFVTVFAIWLVFRFILEIARLSLIETLSDASGNDVQLYSRLKYALILGATVTTLTVMANELHLGYELAELFNRLFMIFLFALSFVLFRGRKVGPALVETALEQQRPYLLLATRILSVLVPFTVFTNAIVGLTGYIDLAWAMAYYQMTFLLVLTLFVLVRGFMIDLFEFISSLSIRYLQNGWLWSQAFLKPVDRLMRLLLFLSAWYFLFSFYGWDENSIVVQNLTFILKYPLLQYFGSAVTLFNILLFIFMIAVVHWIARWSREFAYRWFFGRTRDVGLRNSLSLFTQYAMVTFAALFSLRTLGISFTAFTYILGGLSVGLGFALRDLASNVINGMALLVERPVRVGDLVSIGTYEGEVTRIGLRSMTVRSWDNMEVMIPNSDPFNKAFINWTHQDSIVRTVVPVKVHRSDDPDKVRTLIQEVLDGLEQILDNPAPQIYMKEIDDALLVFEVRYFINLQLHSRVATRSLVLFALWQRFKDENIRYPYPQQDLYVRALPSLSPEV